MNKILRTLAMIVFATVVFVSILSGKVTLDGLTSNLVIITILIGLTYLIGDITMED